MAEMTRFVSEFEDLKRGSSQAPEVILSTMGEPLLHHHFEDCACAHVCHVESLVSRVSLFICIGPKTTCRCKLLAGMASSSLDVLTP